MAPPVKLLSLPHFFDRELLIYWPYRTGEARGKHKAPDCPPSSSRTIPPKPTVATAESKACYVEGQWRKAQPRHTRRTPNLPNAQKQGRTTATISFGQPMPEREMRRAEQLTLDCDLFSRSRLSIAKRPNSMKLPTLPYAKTSERCYLLSSSTDSGEVVEIYTAINLFWLANAFWPFPFAAAL